MGKGAVGIVIVLVFLALVTFIEGTDVQTGCEPLHFTSNLPVTGNEYRQFELSGSFRNILNVQIAELKASDGVKTVQIAELQARDAEFQMREAAKTVKVDELERRELTYSRRQSRNAPDSSR